MWRSSAPSQVSSLPMPPYKPLLPYFDAVKDLLAKYDTLEFNPKKGDALLAGKGFKKQDGIWTDAGRQAAHARRSSASAPSAPRSGRCCRRC